MPFVAVRLLDISKKGIGFSSPKKLQKITCELRIRSFPLLKGYIVYRRNVKSVNGGNIYQYGFLLNIELNQIQLENLGCRGIINLDNPDGLLS
ncbi:putative uncharacterized protein [Aliivibrio wodanis]|uniref:PilZ domain-containing protein n=1 Tax=Aliivibrio wodanis TaxID=80852 RepID=A0A090I756_9GAMM|nr:putative uncharacterized protein [Aliivibrio wodanis]